MNAFREWRKVRISTSGMFDGRIYDSDIDNVPLLEKDSFEYAMCKFLAEITKVKDGLEYPEIHCTICVFLFKSI